MDRPHVLLLLLWFVSALRVWRRVVGKSHRVVVCMKEMRRRDKETASREVLLDIWYLR